MCSRGVFVLQQDLDEFVDGLVTGEQLTLSVHDAERVPQSVVCRAAPRLQLHVCVQRPWRVVQDSEIRFFLRQHAEHHVPGRFPAAVQNPGREGLERTQRADVDDDARQASALWDRAQNSRGQTERRAHVQ